MCPSIVGEVQVFKSIASGAHEDNTNAGAKALQISLLNVMLKEPIKDERGCIGVHFLFLQRERFVCFGRCLGFARR